MPDLFESEIGAIQVACRECGAPLEIASNAMSVFGSQDAVLCMDCLLRHGAEASPDAAVPLPERIRLIDETVDDFAAHLRNVLMRCVKPDMTWNREYGLEDWSHPGDVIAAAYAPGIWYTIRQQHARPRRRSDD